MKQKNNRFSTRNSILFICIILSVVIFASAFSLETVHGEDVETTQTPMPPIDEPQFEAYALYTPTPLAEVSSYSDTASFTFRDIGQASINLRFPSIGDMYVAFPNQWEIFYSAGPNCYHPS